LKVWSGAVPGRVDVPHDLADQNGLPHGESEEPSLISGPLGKLEQPSQGGTRGPKSVEIGTPTVNGPRIGGFTLLFEG